MGAAVTTPSTTTPEVAGGRSCSRADFHSYVRTSHKRTTQHAAAGAGHTDDTRSVDAKHGPTQNDFLKRLEEQMVICLDSTWGWDSMFSRYFYWMPETGYFCSLDKINEVLPCIPSKYGWYR